MVKSGEVVHRVIQSLAMTEYYIEWGFNADDLAEAVTLKLKEGWQLVGAPFVAEVEHMGSTKATKFFQALAK